MIEKNYKGRWRNLCPNFKNLNKHNQFLCLMTLDIQIEGIVAKFIYKNLPQNAGSTVFSK